MKKLTEVFFKNFALATIIILLSFITTADWSFAADRLFYEDFNDQAVNSPFTARASGLWNITPPTHSWGEGRGGSGYSFGSGTTHDVWVGIEEEKGG